MHRRRSLVALRLVLYCRGQVGSTWNRAQTADSREAVDDIVGKAQTAGGGVDPCPKQDYGFMYGRSFEDPDGHIWEVMWMDVAAATGAIRHGRRLIRCAGFSK